jgi:hypothetical protein
MKSNPFKNIGSVPTIHTTPVSARHHGHHLLGGLDLGLHRLLHYWIKAWARGMFA